MGCKWILNLITSLLGMLHSLFRLFKEIIVTTIDLPWFRTAPFPVLLQQQWILRCRRRHHQLDAPALPSCRCLFVARSLWSACQKADCSFNTDLECTASAILQRGIDQRGLPDLPGSLNIASLGVWPAGIPVLVNNAYRPGQDCILLGISALYQSLLSHPLDRNRQKACAPQSRIRAPIDAIV